MDVITDMVIRFTVDDLRDMIFETIRKKIPAIDIYQYELEIMSHLDEVTVLYRSKPVDRN